jgi:hypothetical protein
MVYVLIIALIAGCLIEFFCVRVIFWGFFGQHKFFVCHTVEAKAKPAQPGLSTQLLLNIVIVTLFIVETISSLQGYPKC